MEIDVTHLKVGDYVEAEFRELDRPRCISDYQMPTGRTYILKGGLREYNGWSDPNAKGLRMPNGQSVRQAGTTLAGGNLIRIIKHVPKEAIND